MRCNALSKPCNSLNVIFFVCVCVCVCVFLTLGSSSSSKSSITEVVAISALLVESNIFCISLIQDKSCSGMFSDAIWSLVLIKFANSALSSLNSFLLQKFKNYIRLKCV